MVEAGAVVNGTPPVEYVKTDEVVKPGYSIQKEEVLSTSF